jgi:hypothetical protein
VEKLFSNAKLIILPYRNLLKPPAIEAGECTVGDFKERPTLLFTPKLTHFTSNFQANPGTIL